MFKFDENMMLNAGYCIVTTMRFSCCQKLHANNQRESASSRYYVKNSIEIV